MSDARESSRTRILELSQGRKVCVAEYGARDGLPVITLHGTPGSRLKYAAADATATSLGLRLISPDRWGYGGTDTHPKPSLSEYARDMRSLADLLGLGRFALIGISGGGPYALAAAAHWDRASHGLRSSLPWGRSPKYLGARCVRSTASASASCRAYPAARDWSSERTAGCFRSHPSPLSAVATFRTARADIELAAMADIGTRLAATFREGLRQGAAGPAIDLKLFSRAWDIRPGDIEATTRLWLGREDRNIPQSAVRLLAQKIPLAELTQLEGQGHLWVLRNYGDVFGWVAGAGSR